MSYLNYLEQSPGLCILYTLIGIIVAVILLYFARTFAHRAIRNFCRVLRNAFRYGAFTVLKGEERLSLRNREVLLSGGLEAVEHDIEREFHRVGTVVARDLQGYPSLNRKLSELIAKIDEDYLQSDEVPPTPPAWINAVDAVAKIPDKGSNIVRDILSDIHKTIIKIQNEAMDEYWKATNKRHSLLSKMMPYWRRLSITLSDVDKTMNGLLERAKNIDNHMQDYEEIRQGTDKALRRLSSSSLTQFFIAGLGLFIAVGAAMVNFHLVALPLSEMVGGSSYIAGFRVSDVAGLFVILLETLMGIFFMEAMRFTKLFPVIGCLDDKWRVRMAGITLGFLCIFAGIETSLAFMRDVIASGNQALVQSLTGTTETFGTGSRIPTVAQMVMGFVLPFALTLVAIPLESFVHAARTVLGIALQGTLRGVSALLRFLGSVFYYLGALLVSLYDLLIFAPLWIEERIVRGKTPTTAPENNQEAAAVTSAADIKAMV